MTPPESLFTPSLPLLLVSAVLLVLGLVAWSGRTRQVVLRAWPSPTLHLAPLYLGLAGLLTTLSPLVPGWLATVLLPLSMLPFAAGVLAVVWLPGFLQPRWLRDATSRKDLYDVRAR
ncbi:hypothetical protein [Ornithinimicrobium pratense]|uniref:Uncharacterized protein n=1 Tax=Ornithinimicrobium pratense TaxID=2593973 RepID=A0A5J6V7Q9_9MICO|nr:hypothetical protein [Ornithinimicrobium pratense]QFG69889.1 hypothetical protein FY030_15305 [Ornithinimicrobium pratense]